MAEAVLTRDQRERIKRAQAEVARRHQRRVRGRLYSARARNLTCWAHVLLAVGVASALFVTMAMVGANGPAHITGPVVTLTILAIFLVAGAVTLYFGASHQESQCRLALARHDALEAYQAQHGTTERIHESHRTPAPVIEGTIVENDHSGSSTERRIDGSSPQTLPPAVVELG